MENKAEVGFLHDIATPISVAQGMIYGALETLKTRPEENAAEIVRLEKALKALDKLAALLKARRDVLTKA